MMSHPKRKRGYKTPTQTTEKQRQAPQKRKDKGNKATSIHKTRYQRKRTISNPNPNNVKTSSDASNTDKRQKQA